MSYDFTIVRQVKSCAKPHRCFWCGEKIEKLQPATRYAGVYDGDFSCLYFHIECWEASIQWQKENGPHDEELPNEGSMKRGLTEER